MIGCTDFSRFAKILTDMEEIHQVMALPPKWHLHRVDNPGRTIADGMQLTWSCKFSCDGEGWQILLSDFLFTCPPHRSDHRKIYRR